MSSNKEPTEHLSPIQSEEGLENPDQRKDLNDLATMITNQNSPDQQQTLSQQQTSSQQQTLPNQQSTNQQNGESSNQNPTQAPQNPDSTHSHNHHHFLHFPGKKTSANVSRTPSSAKLAGQNQNDDKIKETPVDVVLTNLKTSENGLTDAEAKRRLDEDGPNSLPDESKNQFLIFLGFLWNPLSWVMEIAAIIAIALLDYVDFGLIIALLVLNAAIGFYEEHNAGNAIAALRSQLAPQCKVKRNGEFKNIQAADLVKGDVIKIRLGDIVPADIKLISGDPVKIDQSSLTGESLPVTKKVGDEAYSGSICRQGEAEGVVYATGLHTFFGKAAALIQNADDKGHLQSVLNKVGLTCLISILLWVTLELVIQFAVRNNAPGYTNLAPLGVQYPNFQNLYGKNKCHGGADNCPTLSNLLVIIVGGIPIAMPTVLSVTMAIGALRLSRRQAVVSRLTAVEELAGMDILCTDKTGTLTLNELSIDRSQLYPVDKFTEDDILFDAALAARAEDNDPIDMCILRSLNDQQKGELKKYKVVHYTPFDPVTKRTVAKVQEKDGQLFRTAKGAPQIILKMAHNSAEIKEAVEAKINEYAAKGYRALGVARSNSGDTPVENCTWEMVGMLPLFDPPRHDTADTIRSAVSMGIVVKMITGDQQIIARETAKQLGMSSDIQSTKFLDENQTNQNAVDDLIEKADGFAEVFPQHKYEIVKRLQHRKHIVGMTGDGVNDAPALKQSDIGIAVAGATDAARGAADIVLLSPGLSVIIDAITGSRKIFQRMKNYAMYSLAMTIRITFTFGILTVAFNWYFPTILIVILAILNDGAMLAISKDIVKPSPLPDSWRLKKVFSLAIIYGLYLTASTLVLFKIASDSNSIFERKGALPLDRHTYEGAARLRALIYLQVSISGQALIFVTRSRGHSFTEKPHPFVLGAFIFAQVAATFIAVYGFIGYPGFVLHSGQPVTGGTVLFARQSMFGCGWAYALVAWLWAFIWYLPLDFIKFGFNYVWDHVEYRNHPELLKKVPKEPKKKDSKKDSKKKGAQVPKEEPKEEPKEDNNTPKEDNTPKEETLPRNEASTTI